MPSDAPTAFFSYSRDDSEFVLRLAGDLKAAGANIWLDQLDIAPGQRRTRAVEDALNSCPRMLVILSPSAVSCTQVEDEVTFALEEHKTVIPLLYQDCKVPFQLRPFQYVDFRADYQRGLQVMLRTLGASHGFVPNAGVVADEKWPGVPSGGREGMEQTLPDVQRAGSDPEHKRAYEKTLVENHALYWQAERQGQAPQARPAYKSQVRREQEHAKAAGKRDRLAEEQARAARREQERIELQSAKAEADRRFTKRVLIAGLTFFAISFVLYAVTLKTAGNNDSWFGFSCAYVSLLMGWRGVIEAVSLRPFDPGTASFQLSILLSGLINPVFLSTMLFKIKNKLQRTFAALRITTLALFPFCWIVFVRGHIMPREGYLVWVAGMLLALFASQMGRLIGRRRSAVR
ncbi:MAG: TIR domain-containing protein [Candidatus Korobacteraceae bacterium]